LQRCESEQVMSIQSYGIGQDTHNKDDSSTTQKIAFETVVNDVLGRMNIEGSQNIIEQN